MDNQFRDVTSVPGQGTAARITDQVAQKADQAKEAVADFGRRTVEGIDARRGPTAATLDHSASALHQQADKVAVWRTPRPTSCKSQPIMSALRMSRPWRRT